MLLNNLGWDSVNPFSGSLEDSLGSYLTNITSIDDIKKHIRSTIVKANGSITYIVVCCAFSLEELRYLDREAVVAVEAVFGTVSLSDNIVIKPR